MAKFFFSKMNTPIFPVHSLAKGMALPTDMQLLKIPDTVYVQENVGREQDDLFSSIRLEHSHSTRLLSDFLEAGIPGMNF